MLTIMVAYRTIVLACSGIPSLGINDDLTSAVSASRQLPDWNLYLTSQVKITLYTHPAVTHP